MGGGETATWAFEGTEIVAVLQPRAVGASNQGEGSPRYPFPNWRSASGKALCIALEPPEDLWNLDFVFMGMADPAPNRPRRWVFHGRRL